MTDRLVIPVVDSGIAHHTASRHKPPREHHFDIAPHRSHLPCFGWAKPFGGVIKYRDIRAHGLNRAAHIENALPISLNRWMGWRWRKHENADRRVCPPGGYRHDETEMDWMFRRSVRGSEPADLTLPGLTTSTVMYPTYLDASSCPMN